MFHYFCFCGSMIMLMIMLTRGPFLESPEKPFIIKTYSVKLIFSFCCKGNKNKNNCKVSCLETP